MYDERNIMLALFTKKIVMIPALVVGIIIVFAAGLLTGAHATSQYKATAPETPAQAAAEERATLFGELMDATEGSVLSDCVSREKDDFIEGVIYTHTTSLNVQKKSAPEPHKGAADILRRCTIDEERGIALTANNALGKNPYFAQRYVGFPVDFVETPAVESITVSCIPEHAEWHPGDGSVDCVTTQLKNYADTAESFWNERLSENWNIWNQKWTKPASEEVVRLMEQVGQPALSSDKLLTSLICDGTRVEQEAALQLLVKQRLSNGAEIEPGTIANELYVKYFGGGQFLYPGQSVCASS